MTSLTITFPVQSVWQSGDLPQVPDNIGHSLQHLKLSNLQYMYGYDTVGTLITEKLLKLDSLELDLLSTDNSKGLKELPHLKTFYVSCASSYRLNSLIRNLSDNGIIEQLKIVYGVFDDDGQDAAPTLNFYKLRTISLSYINRLSGLLMKMTRSQMPDFHRMVTWNYN